MDITNLPEAKTPGQLMEEFDLSNRLKSITGLYKVIQETYDELCARNPKSSLLPLVTFNDFFPDPTPAFERKYRHLIKEQIACIFLEAHQQYLKDLNGELAKTY